MSGLIEYVINDDFFNSVKDEVTCTICLDIKIDPLMCTKCQNSYCANCIKIWQKKSDKCPFKCDSPSFTKARIIKNLLSKLNFKCKNGCEQIIPYDKVLSHYDSDCEKINFKERYEQLLVKYNELANEKKQLEENFDLLFDFDMNSEILETSNEVFFIHRTLSKYYKQNFELELLYRATRDGDNGKKFHQCCDNKLGGVLVIIQTDKNVKFGGFSDAVWISCTNLEGKNIVGDVNFLFQINKRKTYALKNYTKKITSIFCRNDLGPCFGELGEDIWIESDNFLKEGGILHKGKEIGRICSFDTADYELTNGERYFKIKELEAFWLGY